MLQNYQKFFFFFQLKQIKYFISLGEKKSDCNRLSSDVGFKLGENTRKIISPFAWILHVFVIQCRTVLPKGCTKLHLLAHAMGRQNCQESVDLKNALLWLLFQHTGSKKEAYNVDHSSWNQETPINCLFHWHPWHTWSSLWQQPLTSLGGRKHRKSGDNLPISI